MSQDFSRRSFVQKSIGITTGVLAAPALSLSQSQTPLRPMVVNDRNTPLGNQSLSAAWKILSAGGSILDAIEKGANVIELDPNDHSVGYGGLPNEDGIVELDASIMNGKSYNAGAVASLRNIKTPASVARKVMEHTDHILLVGKGALKFAKAYGFQEENLLTEESRRIWLEWKENISNRDNWIPNEDYKLGRGRPTGTYNILAIDQSGDIAGITTTSGLAYKIAGRVGDSPIIGAGLYVDNAIGAAGATGRGEEVIKVCGSFLAVEKMREGMSPQQACEYVCKRIIDNYNGRVFFNDKFIAINKNGEYGCAQVQGNSDKPPYMGIHTHNGIQVYEGKNLINL